MSRIAIVDLLFYWPPGGGSFIDVKEIATRLARDNEVTLFLPQIKSILPFKSLNLDFLLAGTKFFKRGKIEGTLPFRVKTIDFNSLEFNYKTLPKKFKAEIDTFKPDYVFLAQGWHLKPYLIKALSAYKTFIRFYTYEAVCPKGDGHFYKLKRPCYIDLLDLTDDSYSKCLACSSTFLLSYPSPVFIHEYLMSLAFSPGYRRMLIDSLSKVHGIIVYNSFLKQRLSKFNENIEVVPSGVDIGTFKLNDVSNCAIKNILVPGRLDDFKKGFSRIYQVATKLWKDRKDFRLLVTVRDKLPRKYKSEFVKNLGWIPHDKVSQIYNESYMVVVPSQWPEPLGIVAIEALASGLPVIASDTGGLPSIIEHGKSGFLFDPFDESALFQKINYLLDNPQKALEMGKYGRAVVEERYSWDAIYENHYKRMFSAS